MHDRARLYVRGTRLISACDRVDSGVPVTSRRVVESPQTERDEKVSAPTVAKTGSALGIGSQRHTGHRVKGARYCMAHNRIAEDIFPVAIEMARDVYEGGSVGHPAATLKS